MWTITGTLFYRAQEVFQGGYREGIDIWASAVLLYKLIVGKTPFESEYHHETIKLIHEGKLTFPTAFDQYSSELKCLLKRMLNRNSEERPSACTCLKSTWFYPIQSHLEQHPGSECLIGDEKNSINESDTFEGIEVNSFKNISSEDLVLENEDALKKKPFEVQSPNTFTTLRHSSGEKVYCIDSG